MRSIRSLQTTAIDSTLDTQQFLLDGPTNSVHTGLVIPARVLALGDLIRVRPFIIGTPGDNPSDTIRFRIFLDAAQIFDSGPFDIDEDQADWGYFPNIGILLGNDGKTYSMFVVPGIVNPEVGPDFVSQSNNWGGVGYTNSYLDPGTLTPLTVDAGQIAGAHDGFGASTLPLNLAVDHLVTVTAQFGTPDTNSTAQLVAARVDIHQATEGNTSGQ